MTSSETRVTFGKVPGGPSRRFGPLHRSTRPARSIMRRPKTYPYTRHISGQRQGMTRVPQDMSNTWQSTAPYHHVPYVGPRRPVASHSTVFAFSPITASSLTRLSSRHKRSHSSTSSSSSKSHSNHSRSSHRRTVSLPTPSHSHGHRHNSHKSKHQKKSSDTSLVFDLQRLGYALPSTIPYTVHSPPHYSPPRYSPPRPSASPPHYNSYSTYPETLSHIHPRFGSSSGFSFAESDPWTFTVPTPIPSPQSDRVHLHSELVYSSGHMLHWNMILPPQTVLSSFTDPSDLGDTMDPSTQDLLNSPACPGAAKIIVRPKANNPALGLWMDKWGPLEIYPSSSSHTSFDDEITVYHLLRAVYEYFQLRLSREGFEEMPGQSKKRIGCARARRVGDETENQIVDKAEWSRPPKRVDVLALWCVFGGFRVCDSNPRKDGYPYSATLDEPGWRVVELELGLRSL